MKSRPNARAGIAAEIVEDLEAALAEFSLIAESLADSENRPGGDPIQG